MCRPGLLIALSVASLVLIAGSARADDVALTHRLAMENYDLGDVAAARASLESTLAELEAEGRGGTAEAARTHALLAVVLLEGLRQPEAAVAQLVAALTIDPQLAIPAAYASDALAEARATAAARLPRPPTCDELLGIEHDPLAAADVGAPVTVAARVGPALAAATVELHLRPEGAAAWTVIPMRAGDGCRRAATLDAAGATAGTLAYFITATAADGRLLAARGSASSAMLVSVRGRAAAPTSASPAPVDADEVPSALLGPEPRRGRGCAGCRATAGTGAAELALVGGVLALVSRRRRR